jgi:hypothetical protein
VFGPRSGLFLQSPGVTGERREDGGIYRDGRRERGNEGTRERGNEGRRTRIGT